MNAWMDARPQTCLALSNGPHEALIAPGAGGRILRWTTDLPRGRHDWLVPVTDEGWPAHAWPKGGMFPLAPFSNRVRDGLLRWQGRVCTLARHAGQPHALHGHAQAATWDVVDRTADTATLHYVHPTGGDGWPWAWSAMQTVHLRPDGLRVTLALTNHDTSPMPAGLGLHPYFTARSVTLRAATQWEHEAELAQRPHPNHQDKWTRGSHTWTVFLSDWNGLARVHWPDTPGLRLVTEGTMSHLVLHAPEGRYLCVEPVTHVCDGANLADAGMPGTGIKRLAPGETLQAQADFIIVPDDAG